MKNIFLLSFILLSYFLSAQGFKGGLIIGGTASQVDGDQWTGYHKVGLQAGVYSRYDFDDKWAFLTEIKYIQKGSSKTVKDNPQANFRVSLSYVEVPFILNYKLKNNITFGAGLSYGQLLNAEVDDSGGTISRDQLDYRNYDINSIIQFKYNINEQLWADIKFAYSISSIKEDDYNKQWNNLFAFGIGYEF